MHYFRFLITAIAVVTFTDCVGSESNRGELTLEIAENVLTRYVEAVRNIDSATVSELWSEESLQHPGFWQSLHITIGSIGSFSDLGDFVRNYDAQVTGIDTAQNHFVVRFDWILKGTAIDPTLSPQISMRHYVVKEGGRFVLINPLDALTQGWRIHQGEICRFIFPESLADGDYLLAMAEMESSSRELLDIFGDELRGGLDVYVTPDGVECGELLLQAPSGAYACISRNLIASTTFVIPHELVHILCARRGHDVMKNAAFSEGIAMALGGSATSIARLSLIQAKNIYNSNMYIPLSDLVSSDNRTFLQNAQITYHETGAFIKFLIDRFGLEKFDELYESIESAEEIGQPVAAVYGQSIQELEERWLAYLDELDLPKIGTDIPGNAQVVFALADAIGDDIGDGNYVYPSGDRFVPGTFDLTRFEVLQDRARVYFRLSFRELGRSVIDETSGVTFAPGALIAIRRGDNSDRHTRRICEDMRFSANEGYDLRIDIGIQVIVYDSHNRMIFATGEILDSISNKAENALEFSLPISLVGDPDDTWGFFVSTVLMHDHGLGFVRSFPRPVIRQASASSFGGGRADRNPPHIDVLLPSDVKQSTVLGGPTSGGQHVMEVPLLRTKR